MKAPKKRDPIKQVMKLRRDGKLREALELLHSEGSSALPQRVLYGLSGALFWEMGKLAKAEEYARKAVNQSPESELASKILFHVLWEADKRQSAEEEIHRFLSIADDDEYRRILNEIGSS